MRLCGEPNQSINANKLASFQLDIPTAANNRYVTFHARTASTAAYRPTLLNITSIWNAVIVSRVGNHYRIRAESWNQSVAPGASVSFGYGANPGSPIGPTSFVVTSFV